MVQVVDFLNGILWSKVFIAFALLSGVYYSLGVERRITTNTNDKLKYRSNSLEQRIIT